MYTYIYIHIDLKLHFFCSKFDGCKSLVSNFHTWKSHFLVEALSLDGASDVSIQVVTLMKVRGITAFSLM